MLQPPPDRQAAGRNGSRQPGDNRRSGRAGGATAPGASLAEGDLLRARDRFGRSLTHWRAYRDRGGFAFILAHVAALATAQGRPRRAARLAGAAREQRVRHGRPRSPILEECLERLLELAGRGGTEHGTAAEGRSLTLEQAVAEALADAPDPA
jgi:hypothetical protein